MKRRIIAVFLAVMMGLSATACGNQKNVQEVNSISVSGILPEIGDVIVTNTYIGTVQPKESVSVYPMASGNVTEVSAVVGNEVKKGDVLLKMDSAEADLEIAEAEEALEKAEKLAEQAEEDAKELEDALEKAGLAEEKANLEVEIEALEKKVAAYKEDYDDAKEDYDDLYAEYNSKKYSSTKANNVWTKAESDAYKKAVEMAKTVMDQAKSIYDTANTELTALKKELDSTSKSITSTTSSSSSSSSSKDSDSKDNSTSTSASSTGNTVYDQMVEDAEKVLEDAKAKLELYQVTSPIDGTVEAVFIRANEKAFEDTVCMVISNKSNIQVTFQVAEAAAQQLNVGDKVIVDKDGSMNEASITEISLMADEQTKLFTVKASVGAVSGFSTGTDVKVYAETKKAQNVLKIPYDALYFQGGTAYVYCADDDEAVRTEVQVGLMNDEYAEILDGLTEEDIVISTWSSQLKNGTDIDLLFVIGGNTVDTEEDASEEGTESSLEDSELTDTDDSDNKEEYKWELPDLD